jgi:hypothetical protein
MKNASNPKQIANATKNARQQRIIHLQDMKDVMASVQGKKILHWILAECRVHQSVWQPSAAIHRDAGKQEIGHLIMRDMVEADRTLAAAMVAEAYYREIEGE